MIVDIYNEVFTNIKNTLVGVNVKPSYPESVVKFPCVVFEEKSNSTNQRTIATNGENYNDITFEVNIFTNSESKVSEAKEIRIKIDNILNGQYRMPRTFSGQTPNFLDTRVYRYTLRYSFTIGQDKKIYRR